MEHQGPPTIAPTIKAEGRARLPSSDRQADDVPRASARQHRQRNSSLDCIKSACQMYQKRSIFLPLACSLFNLSNFLSLLPLSTFVLFFQELLTSSTNLPIMNYELLKAPLLVFLPLLVHLFSAVLPREGTPPNCSPHLPRHTSQ